MNEDMPWVNLTQEEVEELRNKKQELTEYGKQKLRELMNKDLIFYTNGKETSRIPSPTLENLTLGTKTPKTKLEIEKTMDCEPYPDEMFEEAERREKSNRVLQRYNDFYNLECSGLPHGTPITPEHQQIIAMESMIDAIRCEYLNREYNHIAIEDIEDLIKRLREQADEFLERVRELKEKNNEQ
jgi:type I site-specific restriction endonuclease